MKKKLFNHEKIIFTLRNELFNEDIPALSVDEYLEHLGTTDDNEDLFEILIHYTQEDIDRVISIYILKSLGINKETNTQKERNLEFIIQKFLEMNINVSKMKSIVSKLYQLENDYIIQWLFRNNY